MALTLYAHPFSSYCQKALIAFYELDLPFTWRRVDEADAAAELERLWPFRKFPVLLDDGRPYIEASIIIEHLAQAHPDANALLPREPSASLQVRFLDRFFDNYVHNPMQSIVGDALREPGDRDPHGVAKSRTQLNTAYEWLDRHMAGRTWAADDVFTLADCAAAPALFYADWVHRIEDRWPNVIAYRTRVNARPSFARCIEEARPFRRLFPLGAPDRD